MDPGLRTCLLALSALLLALFPKVILRGEVFFERDVLIVWVAQVEAFVRAINAGDWPVWDPGVGFGHPMLGNPNTQVFYPFTWLNLLVRPLTLYVFYVFAHLLIAGAGFHLWARRVGLTPAAATLGACVFVGSGPLLSLVNVWHHLAGAAWLPWVLWAADLVFGGGARHLLALALLLTIQIYAGSPDLCVFTGLVLGADALRRVSSGRFQWRPFASLAIAGALSVCLAAAQLAPSLDLALHAGGRPLPIEARTTWSLHPAALIQTMVPVSFSSILTLTPQAAQSLFDLWSPFIRSNYLGLASILLVAAALVAPGRRASVFFAFLFATSLAVALGRYSPVYEWLASVMPPLKMVRYPSKAIIVAALAWAMLVGQGYDAWRDWKGRIQAGLRVVLPVVVLLFAAWLFASAAGHGFFPGIPRSPLDGPTWSAVFSESSTRVMVASILAALVSLLFASGDAPARWRAGLVPLLVIVDLTFNNRSVNATTAAAPLNRRPDVLRAIPRDPPARVYVWDYVLRVPGRGHPTTGILGNFLEVSALPDPAMGALAFQEYLYPPSGPRWGLRGSFDRDLLNLYPPYINDMNLLLRAVEDTPAYVQLLQLAGVSRVVALHRDLEALPLLTKVEGVFRVPIQVFEVPDPWPRTYVVCRSRTVPPERSLETLLARDFDPNQEALIDPAVSPAGACHQGVSRIVDDRSDRVSLEATLDGSGMVVLLDGHAAGWEVRVDGVPDKVLRVNHIFRGVKVGPGRHQVEFVYRPTSLLMGLALSLLTALGASTVLIVRRISRRRTIPSANSLEEVQRDRPYSSTRVPPELR